MLRLKWILYRLRCSVPFLDRSSRGDLTAARQKTAATAASFSTAIDIASKLDQVDVQSARRRSGSTLRSSIDRWTWQFASVSALLTSGYTPGWRGMAAMIVINRLDSFSTFEITLGHR